MDMFGNIYIKRILTVFLLANFALSNTPTRYLHALFANHKDFSPKTETNSPLAQLNAAGINCHCESNVVIAPYTVQHSVIIKPVETVIPVLAAVAIDYIIPRTLFSFGLRGPPSFS